ncbi:MAG: hypothetical protein IT373_15500, partial [Polyangiaceae bacterium]|nr:hypothetical protein [Polyangiaceae bacterium]
AGGADAAHRPAGQRLARIAELAARMQKLLGDLHDVDVAADAAGATRRLDEATRALLQAALRARRLELVADALAERVRIARALRL